MRLAYKVCESPIESRMFLALMDIPYFGETTPFETWEEYKVAISSGDRMTAAVIPQVPVGKYRADILLACASATGDARVVVECDGFDFHAATDEQATADKIRDRAMVDMGFFVCRFTGSQILRHARDCALQVADKLFEAKRK